MAAQGPALYTDKECLRLACGHLPPGHQLSRAGTSLCPLGPLLACGAKVGRPALCRLLQIRNSQGPKSRPKHTSIKMCLKRTFSAPAGPLPAPTLGFWADFWKQTCHQLPRAEQLPQDLGGAKRSRSHKSLLQRVSAQPLEIPRDEPRVGLAVSRADPVPSSLGPRLLPAPALSCLPPLQLLDKREPLSCQQPSQSTLGHQHVGPGSPDRKGHRGELGLPGPAL